MSQSGRLSNNGGGGSGTIMTLSGEGGPPTPPIANNFNFSGSIAGGSAANGAIDFITPGGPGAATDGQMDAVVLTDGTTIQINASNQLEVIGDTFGETITGDTGGPLPPTAGNWNIISNVATSNAGNTVLFSGSGSTITLNVTDGGEDTFIGRACGAAGGNAANTGLGASCMNALTGSGNTAVGRFAMLVANSAQSNVAFGSGCLSGIVTGSFNAAFGTNSGSSYTNAESSNINILNTGTILDNNTIRIGTQGAGAGQQNRCFIAGITGVSVSNLNFVTINTATGQLGATAATGIISTWTDVTGTTQALSVNNGYFTDNGAGVTYTLPATATLGDVIKINGKLGLATVAQNASQSIRLGSSITTVGVTGSLTATNVGDCLTLRCSTAGASTVWIVESSMGNWTVA